MDSLPENNHQNVDANGKRRYRSVWISDVHLCTKECQSGMLQSFLESITCDNLYLIGDIVDIWALRRRKWHWPEQYNDILHRLLEMSRSGVRIVYLPGNHDEFFRSFLGYAFGALEIVHETIHITADGRRLLILHGDDFDSIVIYHKWLSMLGSRVYAYLVGVNRMFNWATRNFGMSYFSLSGSIKRKIQQAIRYIKNFEAVLVQEALRMDVDGVICGHIHQPVLEQRGSIFYGNTGDWVENCTALVEQDDGRLELIWWHYELEEGGAELSGSAALYRKHFERMRRISRVMPIPAPQGHAACADRDR